MATKQGISKAYIYIINIDRYIKTKVYELQNIYPFTFNGGFVHVENVGKIRSQGSSGATKSVCDSRGFQMREHLEVKQR